MFRRVHLMSSEAVANDTVHISVMKKNKYFPMCMQSNNKNIICSVQYLVHEF